MLNSLLTLIRLILRRDRIKLPIFIALIVGLLLFMVPVLYDLYGDDPEGLNGLFLTFGTNPAGLFITGPMDVPTFGGLMTIESLVWWGVAVALLNTFFIVRHTRKNEEIGSQEIILSAPVPRSHGLTAALAVAIDINIIIALGIGGGFSLFGDLWTLEQAWLFGIAFGLFGFLWAAIAAVVVQLVESARAANGILGLLLGLSFVLRGIGDFTSQVGSDGLLSPGWASYVSPLGWLQMTRPLTFPEWSPLLIIIGVSLLFCAGAYLLLAIRDTGSGIIPARAGKARAGVLRRSLGGLTWYVHKNAYLAYLVGALLLVATVGGLMSEMSGVLNSSEEVMDVIVSMGGQGDLVTAFLAAMLTLTIIAVIGYVVNVLEVMRREEVSGRVDNLLATKVSKTRWLLVNIGTVVLAAVSILVLAGATLAITTNLFADVSVDVGTYILAALSYMPLVLFMVGLYTALYGLIPRIVGIVLWSYFGFMAFVTWLGPMLQIDQLIMNLSLFEHVASPPAEDINYGSLLTILVAGIILMTVGFVAWLRRDIKS